MRACREIAFVNGSTMTWQHVADATADDPAIEIAIQGAGGHRKIADRNQFTSRQIEDAFVRAYERERAEDIEGYEP
jgi:hypothetical protein